MIGSGLKKLAEQHGMSVGSGVAYGSLMGYATTLSEGKGYKRIDIATKFAQTEQRNALAQAVNGVDVAKEYRVQEMSLRLDTITVVFQDTVGTMKKLEAFIAWFYPLLANYGAAGANVCAHCGTDAAAGGWYLLDGVARRFHDGCAASVQNELATDQQARKDADTGSYVQGAVGAAIGALLGAVVWALVLMAGYVASIVGFVIGWLAEKGYNLLKGKQGKGKVVILIFAVILGVLVGTVAPDAVTLAQMIDGGELPGFTYGDIPALILEVLAESPEYMESVLLNAGMGLLFAALGVYTLLRQTGKAVSDRKLKKLQ